MLNPLGGGVGRAKWGQDVSETDLMKVSGGFTNRVNAHRHPHIELAEEGCNFNPDSDEFSYVQIAAPIPSGRIILQVIFPQYVTS